MQRMTGVAVKKQDGNSRTLRAALADEVSVDVEPWDKPVPRGVLFKGSEICRFRIIDELPFEGVGEHCGRGQKNQ